MPEKKNALEELAEKLAVDAGVISAYKDELGEGEGTIGQLVQDDIRKAQRIVAELGKPERIDGRIAREIMVKCRAIAAE